MNATMIVKISKIYVPNKLLPMMLQWHHHVVIIHRDTRSLGNPFSIIAGSLESA